MAIASRATAAADRVTLGRSVIVWVRPDMAAVGYLLAGEGEGCEEPGIL